MLPFAGLDRRSLSVLTVPGRPLRYVFSSSVRDDATVEEVLATGADCAEYMGWCYGPWRRIPHYTGAIYDWAESAGRLIPVAQRKPGDMVIRQPGWRGIAIGHVGMVLANINMIRQARSAHTNPNCGDWLISAGTWQNAIRMDAVLAAPPQPSNRRKLMLAFVRVTDTPAVYLSIGTGVRLWMATPQALKEHQDILRFYGYTDADLAVHVIDAADLAKYGLLVGPDAP